MAEGPWTRVPGLLAACAITLAWGAFLVLETRAATTKGTDYFYYYCVSHLVAIGHGHDIYSLAVLGHVERALASPVRVPHGVIPNVYPPFFALALTPLAALPYALGYCVWLVINCLCLAWSLWKLEGLLQLTGRRRVATRAAALLFLPVIVALLNGQVSIILLAAFTGCWLSLRSGHDGRAGILLALTLIKPQFALPFLLVLLIGQRWRALMSFLAGALAIALVPIPVLGPASLTQYVHALQQATTWGANVGGFQPSVNRSFAGFTSLLMPHGPATVLALLLDAAALCALAWVAVRNADIDLPFALGIVVALLASQHVLIHDLSLLILAGAIAWSLRDRGPYRVAWWMAAVYLTVYAGFFLARPTHVQIPTLALCAMGVWLLRCAHPDAAQHSPTSYSRAAPCSNARID